MSFSAASLYAVLESSVPEGARGLVVALSGGADSAALLAGLAGLSGGFRGLPLRAVDLGHGPQAAAAGFCETCPSLFEHLGVPPGLIRVEGQSGASLSIHAAARGARHAAR